MSDDLIAAWHKVAVRASGLRREGMAVSDYGGQHQPPRDGPPLHDLIGDHSWFPDDVYTSPQFYVFGGSRIERETIDVIRRARGDPNARVTIYRSLPPWASPTIETGNWVALSKTYASQHGMEKVREFYDPDLEWELDSGFGGVGRWVEYDNPRDWPTVEATVRASDVRNGGNDLIEWGYWGPSVRGRVIPGERPPDRGHYLQHPDRGGYRHSKVASDDLISSWRQVVGQTAGRGQASAGDTIYRGFNVPFPPEIDAQIRQYLSPPTEPGDIDQHLKIGSVILEYLQSNHWDAGVGLGRHWTTRKPMADTAARVGPGWGVTLTATFASDDDIDHDERGGWNLHGEDEITLKPGARITVTDVELINSTLPRGMKLLDRSMQATAGMQEAYRENGEVGNSTHITYEEQGTVPTDVIADMPGVMGERPGEHRNKHGQVWEDFKADIAARGIQSNIFVTVDYGEQPEISEGNHRRDAALELGLDEVPLTVRYFGKAEDQGTIMERYRQGRLGSKVLIPVTARADWWHNGDDPARASRNEYVHLGTYDAAAARRNIYSHRGLYRVEIAPRNPLNSPSSPLEDGEANILGQWMAHSRGSGEAPPEDFEALRYRGDAVDVIARTGWTPQHDAIYYENFLEDKGSVSVMVLPSAIRSSEMITGEQMALFAGRTATARPYFHGTRWPLQPGDILEGGRFQSNQGYGQPGEHVYVTDRRDVAWSFAEAGYGPPHDLDARPKVYEVEPLDGIEADPDEDEMFGSFRGHRFRVVRDVATRSMTARGPGAPVYRGLSVEVDTYSREDSIEALSSPVAEVRQIKEAILNGARSGGVGTSWTFDFNWAAQMTQMGPRENIQYEQAGDDPADGGFLRIPVILEARYTSDAVQSGTWEEHGVSGTSPSGLEEYEVLLRRGASIDIDKLYVGVTDRRDAERMIEEQYGASSTTRFESVMPRGLRATAAYEWWHGFKGNLAEYGRPDLTWEGFGPTERMYPNGGHIEVTQGGRYVGGLAWNDEVIQGVDVLPEFQRQGIATLMLELVRAEMEPRLKHDWTDMSDEGAAWARSVGSLRATAGSVRYDVTFEGGGRSPVGTEIPPDKAEVRAYDGGTLVGHVRLNSDFDHLNSETYRRWKVWNIWVDEGYRGEGVAEGMLQALHNERPGEWIYHGGFSSSEGQGFADSMVSKHPQWNRMASRTPEGQAWSRVVGSAEEIIDVWRRVVAARQRPALRVGRLLRRQGDMAVDIASRLWNADNAEDLETDEYLVVKAVLVDEHGDEHEYAVLTVWDEQSQKYEAIKLISRSDLRYSGRRGSIILSLSSTIPSWTTTSGQRRSSTTSSIDNTEEIIDLWQRVVAG